MHAPPAGIDLLILEGANLGADKPVMPESALETAFTDLMARTKGRVFVAWQGQNIDRTVTLYRAARRSGRDLVIDLHTAEVLEGFADGTRLPRPGFDGLKIVLTRGLRNHYRRAVREDFIRRMARHGIPARALTGSHHVAMLRDGLLPDFRAKRVTPTAEDAFAWSMWRGYLRDASLEIARLHTSGHAAPSDLRAFAAAIRAGRVIPVHGTAWERSAAGFENLCLLHDGQALLV